MGYSQGIDFRQSSGFVTDPSGSDFEIGTTANYPRTSAQGNTVGWEQAPSGTRNRSAAVDARLAGIAFNSSSSSEIKYRLDVVANGTYTLTLAVGDATTSQNTTCKIYDGSTLLATIGGSTTGGQFFDASNVKRTSAADWVANEQTITVTITSGILRIGILQGGSASGVIAHIKAVQTGVAITLTDTGLTVSDSIQKSVGRNLIDTGLTVTDTASTPGHIALFDTGVAVTDSLASLRLRLLTTTGLSVTDALVAPRLRFVTDTGLALSDSLLRVAHRFRSLSDTGLTISDSAGGDALTDTGLTITDLLIVSWPRTITDTGLTITDSFVKAASKRITDTGLTVSDALWVSKNNSSFAVHLTGVGLVLSDAISRNASHGRLLTDTGAAVTDSIFYRVVGPAPPPCPGLVDFQAFVTEMEASTEYASWCGANPAECSTWQTYSNSILTGHLPPPPPMGTLFGSALVDAGIVALDAVVLCLYQQSPRANFTFAVAGLNVNFINTSTPGLSGTITSFLWDFGDGTTDPDTWDPGHTYMAAGTYTVTLIIVGGGSDGSSSIAKRVTVSVSSATGFHLDLVAV